MKRGFLFIAYIFISISIFANSIAGLSFSAHTVTKEKRTSLLLKEGNTFKLKKGFTLDFDIKFLQQEHNYGYVFRIIADDNTCFDLVSNFKVYNKLNLSFIEGNQLYLPLDSLKYTPGDWANIQFIIEPETQTIRLSFNDTEIKTHYTNKNLSSFRFQFGYCDHPDFTSYDVPPMTIRDVKLYDHNKTPLAIWKLKEHNGDLVYDSIHSTPAIAYNPTWEIDKYVIWKKETAFTAPIYTQVAYNGKSNCIYFANREYLLRFTPAKNATDTIKIKSGAPFHISSNQLIYNEQVDELWSYDFEDPRISVFDRQTQSWSNTANVELRNPTHTHHNSFISPVNFALYVFGGYGEYKYRNELKLHPNQSNEWIVQKNLPISPRYLSSIGLKNNDTLLIFGGYGHESGLQELGPHNYYDLYAVDLKTYEVKKIWEQKEKEQFLPSNQMIVDNELNKFYTLCFPSNRTESYIVLKSFDLDNGESKTLGDTIPYIFEDIKSYCTLYRDSTNKKLYAITIYNSSNKAEINVYSLAFPPLKHADSIQTPPTDNKNNLLLAGLIFLIILSLLLVLYRIRKKRKGLISNSKGKIKTEKVLQNQVEENPAIVEDITELIIPHKSSILFLGGFQVWDKNGEDITKQFTPVVKNLFILIILYSQKNKKGILSSTLREILWYDKSEENAQNNVRVNIRKLKLLFDRLEGIELINTNTYWSLNTQEPFYCDYKEVFDIVHSISKNKILDRNELYHFIQLLAQGQPLPYVQQDWIDTFKADYANMVQDALWKLSQADEIKADYNLQTMLADAIFLFDPTDENAMRLKCMALYNGGRLGLAKSTYDIFCSEYERLLNVKYTKSFNEICANS